jgi:hypothetical protein
LINLEQLVEQYTDIAGTIGSIIGPDVDNADINKNKI